MAGFTFAFRESGGAPTIVDLLFKDTETLTKGDLVNLETGEVDLLATADTNALGVVLETKSGTDSTTRIKCIVDADARLLGATLDVAGTTGAMTVATSSNKNFVVARESSATEPTLVKFNVGKHAFNVAQ
jgi:hypothetical protein